MWRRPRRRIATTPRGAALHLTALLVLAACATTPPPPPVVAPQGEDRYLVDPRIGYTGAADPRFENIWRLIQAGQTAIVRPQLAELRAENPNYLPASLADAAIALHEKNLDAAGAAIARVQSRSDYLAADIYEAELALRSGDLRRAAGLYARLAPSIPDISKERANETRQRLFDELVASAANTNGPDAIALLREALTLNPSARDVRILVVQKLLAQRNWDEARAMLDPLVNSEPDRPDVQESLAEIEVGQGQFEKAINRYERLARREHDPRYARRLEEIKEQWNAANMPPQYLRAAESEAITRGDFAVLLYWKVASIRFAQNLGIPPIAVDIGDVLGREEMIRAIALGILQVDPVTRRVGPSVPLTANSLTRYAARTLTARGAPCARGLSDPSRILNACSVTDPSITLPPDAPISGRAAESVIEEIDRVLSR
jgi:tetratricopeptide (TPR) repeat protein